jgi:hypothetical protein
MWDMQVDDRAAFIAHMDKWAEHCARLKHRRQVAWDEKRHIHHVSPPELQVMTAPARVTPRQRELRAKLRSGAASGDSPDGEPSPRSRDLVIALRLLDAGLSVGEATRVARDARRTLDTIFEDLELATARILDLEADVFESVAHERRQAAVAMRKAS